VSLPGEQVLPTQWITQPSTPTQLHHDPRSVLGPNLNLAFSSMGLPCRDDLFAELAAAYAATGYALREEQDS